MPEEGLALEPYVDLFMAEQHHQINYTLKRLTHHNC